MGMACQQLIRLGVKNRRQLPSHGPLTTYRKKRQDVCLLRLREKTNFGDECAEFKIVIPERVGQRNTLEFLDSVQVGDISPSRYTVFLSLGAQQLKYKHMEGVWLVLMVFLLARCDKERHGLAVSKLFIEIIDHEVQNECMNKMIV